jgi:predicted extracellular nuclease
MHASRSLTKRVIGSAAAVGLLGGLITVAATTSQVVSAAPTVIASDLTGGAPVNLTSYTNPWTGAFASAADGFEIYQRVVSASIPFSVLDDTLATFPPDTQGIVDDNNLDRFFGAVDTENPQNSGPVSATWVFDITGGTDLALSIDSGAMGDFESSDTFVWEYSIDGGATATAFASTVDEDGNRTYTLASGTMVTLNDPMNVGSTEMSNLLQPVQTALSGTGSSLTLRLTATMNGGDEAIAFQNIQVISDSGIGGPAVGDLVITEIMQNPSAVSNSNGEWFEIANVSGDDVDLDGWTISDEGTDTHTIAGTVIVPAGGYAVLGRNADFVTNGGVAVDYEYSSFFLSNSADEVLLTSDDSTLFDRVAYDGGPSFPDPTGASMGLEPTLTDIVSNDDGANWCTTSSPLSGGDNGTPGAENDSCTTPPFGECGDSATLIHDVQGNGFSSPIVGQLVNIEGVVVGDFQASNELSGFFVQEEDADADADPDTSEGIFVFDNGFGIDVAAGDVVRVAGTVNEFFGLTRLESITNLAICSAGASVTPNSMNLPVSGNLTWESSEGMSVNFTQTLYASGNFTLARFGEVDLSVGGPLDNPTNVVAPGAPANAMQDLNNRSRIQLDDGSNVQNPVPIPPYFAADGTLRTGDSIDDLDAVLNYAFGNYEVHPTEAVTFARLNDRPTEAPDVGGSMTVAAYNVLNYFTTIDGNGPICGPNGDQGCRGADSQFEFDRQEAKLVEAITALDADVLGIMEVENAADDTPIAALVTALNAVAGAGTYAHLPTGPVGDDAIRVAFIYKPANVETVGSFAILDSSVDPTFNDTRNRVALAQTFREIGTDDLVTVAVNHLKSKGSACSDIGDPDTGDGQGNCNLTRTTAAAALATWMTGDPTASGSADNIIVGDLNAYAQEDPITTIEAAGYADLVEAHVGMGWSDGAYSFNFFSQSGYLDHGLSSPSLVTRVTGADLWHVNSDEPSGLDYNSFNQAVLYNPDRYRSSDHDPVVVGICEATAPVVSVTADPDVLWPANHKYVDVSTTVDVTDADENATVTLLSVTSNEPDNANGNGDGNTVNDIVIVDDDEFQLRAERSGKGSGRIYTITYEVTDACGNSTIASATVTVPHDKEN